MDDYLTKPVDPARLAEALDRWVAPEEPAAEPAYAERLDLARLSELRALDEPGERSYVDRAIGNFLTNGPDDIATLRTAGDEGDAARLRAVAHRLAGSALNLGAVSSGELARALEEDVVDGFLDKAVAALRRLTEELDQDLEALRAYQREYAAGSS